jgi:hypothetical protein
MTPTDPVAPAGITWDMAMTNAGEMLSSLDRKTHVTIVSARAAHAQAWIAFAREPHDDSRAQR